MSPGDPRDPNATLGELLPTLRELRHDLHRHPELGFEETRTQAICRAWLEARGYRPRACAGTGLVADLHPDRVGRAPTVALRADLDCLPMEELTDLPYRSIHAGRAHKCGHDGHTAILLGVADLLAREREAIAGNVRLVFQPAEEGVRGGGAKVMIAEGALADVAEIYGLHNWPGFPRGELRVRAGAMMARVDNFSLTIRGKGGHGSQPQRCRDPIVAGAHLVTALQTLVSRELGLADQGVVSICAFQAGTTYNVIPGEARLLGTIRTFSAAVYERILGRLRAIQGGVAAALGVTIDLDFDTSYPALINDPTCAAAVARAGARVVGEDRVGDADLPMAGAEDFAYFTQAIPGAYFFLGAGRPGEDTPICHHPDFDFDDGLLPTGVAAFLEIVRDRLAALQVR